LLLVMMGTMIFTVGVVALCAQAANKIPHERIFLWFGLFAAPYGLALVCRTMVIQEWSSAAEVAMVVIGKLIGFLAIVPALLLFQEFYGRGWRLSSRWLIGIYLIAVVSVLTLMASKEHSHAIPSPGLALVILVPLVLLIDLVAGYRLPTIMGRSVMFVGLLVFFLAFSYDHLLNYERGSVHFIAEPCGFLILMACLGYVVSRRVEANQSAWLSMTDEMRAARRIQTAILPTQMPAAGEWSIAARYEPMTAVAGDFYGFPSVQPTSIGIILADVMGHGVPAALIASMVKVSAFAGVERRDAPSSIIEGLNATLCREAPGQLATAVYVSLNKDTGIGRYTSAGQPPPLLWRKDAQALDHLDVAGLLMGVRNGEIYDETEFKFGKGDRLILYSDGLTEAEDRAGKDFGDHALPDLLRTCQDLPAEQVAELLLEKVLAWSGGQQADDITFVLVDL
jgi:sigma-B regulation protein RsbU (phosphoserine phosphatase)